jgi:hypothetical protein
VITQLIPAGGVNRIPAFDARSGEHYWILPMAFSVTDPERFMGQPDGPVMFDRENLVLATAVCCYHCEQIYTKLLASRRCRGTRSDA